MKNLKVFLCLIAVFAITIGIKVNALEEQRSSEMDIVLPIHKTDEAGKGLESAVFTLKDFNNTISFSSSDKKNGDYLIETYKENEDILDKNINLLPDNYKEVITSIKSWEDVQKLRDRDDLYSYGNEEYAHVNFFIPLKLEESVVPSGYQKQDFVIAGMISFDFYKVMDNVVDREDIEARSEYYDDFYDSGIYVYSYLSVNEIPDNVPGYFIYDSSKDYAALFKEINKKIVAGNDDEYDSYEEYISKLVKPFEDEGYNTKDVECPSVKPSEGIVKREDFGDIEFRGWNPYCGGGDITILREDIEARFDDSISDCYCVIQLKNKKENIIVNPETASTIGIISLITLGSIGFITAKKLRKNN